MGFSSILYLASTINWYLVTYDLFVGKYEVLGFFDTLYWYSFMLNASPLGVVSRNWDYIFKKQMASTAAAIQFKVFFMWTLFIRLGYPSVFEDA